MNFLVRVFGVGVLNVSTETAPTETRGDCTTYPVGFRSIDSEE